MMQSRTAPGIRSEIYETLLLYAVFFLPAYLLTGTEIDPSVFQSVFQNFMMLASSIPQLFLLIFIVSRKRMLRMYGFRPFRLNDVGWALSIFVILWMIVSAAMLLLSFLPLPPPTDFFGSERILANPGLIIILFIVSITTGYLEEGFFRCYLYRQARRIGASYASTVIGVSVLFGIGHLYQGIHGVIVTALIGLVLQHFYARRLRTIHPIAIGHGLYNFSVFLIAIFA